MVEIGDANTNEIIQGATSTLFSVISGPFLFSVVFFVGLFVLF